MLGNFSETGCSFARHFAILSRNVGILIGSLLRASCDSNFNLLFKYCELTAMASNITSVSKREKVISLATGLKQLFFLRILPVESASQL